MRRASLQKVQAEMEARAEMTQQASLRMESLTAYCAQVRAKPQGFDFAAKRKAIEALDIKVTWVPGQPLTIQGTIPLEEDIASKAV